MAGSNYLESAAYAATEGDALTDVVVPGSGPKMQILGGVIVLADDQDYLENLRLINVEVITNGQSLRFGNCDIVGNLIVR